jgi:hypothetical protein
MGSTHLASALGDFAALLCAKSRDWCEDDVAFGQLVEAQLNVIRLESALHKGSTFLNIYVRVCRVAATNIWFKLSSSECARVRDHERISVL